MPGLVGGFGNYILPIQCGAVDMAFLIKILNKYQINNKDNIKNNKNESINENFLINSIQKYKKVEIKEFASYLAGLFEGDGYI
jgi:heme/copper-type cytochrome/quinol oxidase subunit 1